MVAKDHFSKFGWLRASSKKEARLVAVELTRLFSETGWPLMFHTDNGGELVAKVVCDVLKEQLFVHSVAGGPRTPQDQGSVERLNQDVKSIVDREIEVMKKSGIEDPSWLDVLGPATAAINNSCSFGSHKLTPHKHVFTMDCGCPLPVPGNEMKSIRTVQELADCCQDPEFNDKLKEMGHASK
jgi:hypothetical protein